MSPAPAGPAGKPAGPSRQPVPAPPEGELASTPLGRTLARTYGQTLLILAVGAVAALGTFAVWAAGGKDPLAGFVLGLLVMGVAAVVAAVRAGTVVARGQRRSGAAYVAAIVLVVLALTTSETTAFVWAVALLVPLLAAFAGRWSTASGRRVLPTVTALAVVAGLLCVDVWQAEQAEVDRVLRDVASAGVTVWVPADDGKGCEPRYVSSSRPGFLRYSWWCQSADPGFVDVTMTADPSRPDSPVPSVRRQQEGSSGFSMVATVVRSGAVVEVRRVGVQDLGRAERLAGSLVEVSPSWVASRGLWLHELTVRTGVWGSPAPARA
jgi:hypothetical protein